MSDASVPPPLSPPPLRPPYPSPGHPGGTPRTARTGSGWRWIALLALLGAGGMAVLLVLSLMTGSAGGASPRPGDHLVESVLEDNGSRNKIAVLSVEGIISGQALGPSSPGLVDLIQLQLDRIRDDDAVRAVVLRVDSPGGEVLASDEIYLAISRFLEETEIPVVASMGSLAASGGYYVSAPCRWIVANELTMTGSIGVIFHSYNYRELMDKVGVRPMVTKSGRLKDMLSGDKRPDDILPEESQIMEAMILESFDRFKEVIRTGRERAARLNDGQGRPLAPDWEGIADGRIVSGRTALEKGLVDELGNFETAVERAQKLAGIDDANLVAFETPLSFLSMFRLFGRAPAGAVKVDLGLGVLPRLPTGRMYFLSPVHLE